MHLSQQNRTYSGCRSFRPCTLSAAGHSLAHPTLQVLLRHSFALFGVLLVLLEAFHVLVFDLYGSIAASVACTIAVHRLFPTASSSSRTGCAPLCILRNGPVGKHLSLGASAADLLRLQMLRHSPSSGVATWCCCRGFDPTQLRSKVYDRFY